MIQLTTSLYRNTFFSQFPPFLTGHFSFSDPPLSSGSSLFLENIIPILGSHLEMPLLSIFPGFPFLSSNLPKDHILLRIFSDNSSFQKHQLTSPCFIFTLGLIIFIVTCLLIGLTHWEYKFYESRELVLF